VTIGFLVSGRMKLDEALRYWAAQFASGIVGAVVLWGLVSGAPTYSTKTIGLGADGYWSHSMIGIGGRRSVQIPVPARGRRRGPR
jgi:aquaporin Z